MPEIPSQKHPAPAGPWTLSQGAQHATLPISLTMDPNSFPAKLCADWTCLNSTSSPPSVLSMHSITATFVFHRHCRFVPSLWFLHVPLPRTELSPRTLCDLRPPFSQAFSDDPSSSDVPLTHLSPYLASLHSNSQVNILSHAYLFLRFLLPEWKVYEAGVMCWCRVMPDV